MARTSKIINAIKNEIQHNISRGAQWCPHEKPIEVGRARIGGAEENLIQTERNVVDKNKRKRINIWFLAHIQSIIGNKWSERDIKKQGHR